VKKKKVEPTQEKKSTKIGSRRTGGGNAPQMKKMKHTKNVQEREVVKGKNSLKKGGDEER